MLMTLDAGVSTVLAVDDPLVSELPDAYRRLLGLMHRGERDDVVAQSLGVPLEAVPGMRRMACRKLERVRRSRSGLPLISPDL